MLEIALIVWYARKIGRIAEEKGLAPRSYKVRAVLLWFGLEVLGAVVGVMAGLGSGAYVTALLGAAFGALAGFLWVDSAAAPPKANPEVFS